MTNLAEAIQNACEIARRDERRKFKGYLEKKRKKYTNGLSIALQKNATQEAIINDKMQCMILEISRELFPE